MKKTLIFGSLFIAFAMMSHGGNTLLAHAQTATTSATTLQQELDDAKAQLVQLQMEAGQVPAGDSSLPGGSSTAVPVPMSSVAPIVSVTPSMTLSATDASEINSVLTALTSMLVSLQSKIAQDPQFATSNGSATVASLQAIGNTLATIVTDAANGANGNVAIARPQQSTASQPSTVAVTPTTGATQPVMPSTQNSAPAATAPTVTPTTPTVTPAPVAVNTVPQTAQAAASFSLGKLNWPLIIVIILIVAAIAIWLWWDDSDDTKQTVVVKTTSPAPQRPLQPSNPVIMSTNNSQGNQGQSSNRPVSGPQTPLSSAVSPQGNR